MVIDAGGVRGRVPDPFLYLGDVGLLVERIRDGPQPEQRKIDRDHSCSHKTHPSARISLSTFSSTVASSPPKYQSK